LHNGGSRAVVEEVAASGSTCMRKVNKQNWKRFSKNSKLLRSWLDL